MPADTQRQLADLRRDYERARGRAEALAGRLSDAQWLRRRDPARWSPAECVVHLNLTSEAALPLLEAGLDIAAGMPPMDRARWRRDPLGWLISTMVGPLGQSGRLRLARMRTTAAFEPRPPFERDVVIADFRRHQAALLRCVDEAEGLPLDRVVVNSPFDPRLQYNLYSLFRILPAHQLRHLVQAERVWA